ncbi:MAG TPA: hypothetical protein VNZ57_10335 [Longimicrobiales bacterium]|nr:hypothetical protein [Longimicrobiales bacterium]
MTTVDENARVETASVQERRDRAAKFATRAGQLQRVSSRVSQLRFATFIAAILAFLWAEIGDSALADAGVPAGIVLAAVFSALVIYHRRVKTKARWFDALRRVNLEAVARIHRDWSGIPVRGRHATAPAEHPYAHDLDIVGHASLFQLLDVTASAPGRATLLEWLLAPAAPAEIPDRQAAVRELALLTDFRDGFSARGLLAREAQSPDVARFLAWAEGEPWLLQRPALLWTTRVLPAATLCLALLAGMGVLAAAWIAVPVIANVIVTAAAGKHAWASFSSASRGEILDHDARLFNDIERQSFESPMLGRLQAQLMASGAASTQMRRLARRVACADVRFSAMAHFPLQILLLWDFHVLFAIERWRQMNGRHVRSWLDALGQTDALAALASLAHDHPDWTFPDVATGEPPVLEARNLAHPLLRPSVARGNDVRVGPPGTFLLVTGSNMSGKSTLLRAIGTNLVLAQAGAPVCADAMRLPPLRLHTSMRVQDSLEEGVSFFMAELRRLKTVVDAASAARAAGTTLLYLLDEILQGTNTAERHLAAQRIILHLLEQGAIGAVTTHDLTLADAKPLAQAADLVHFRETIERIDGEMRMSFDYKLRRGLATSTNALALMEMVGLGGDG